MPGPKPAPNPKPGGGGGGGGGGQGGGNQGGGGNGGGNNPNNPNNPNPNPGNQQQGGGDAARTQAILDRFKAEYPGLWESLSDQQRSRYTKMATETAKAGSGYFVFRASTWTTPAWNAWHTANPGVGGAPEGTDPSDPTTDEPFIDEAPPDESISMPTPSNTQDIRAVLAQFLTDNDLPISLNAFISDALAQGMGPTEIVARLRETPEYKAAYPENDLRKANGFSWMPESQVRAMRDEIKRLTRDISHVDLTPNEVAGIIAKDKSLSEWEGQLKDYQTFKRWGPTVQSILQQELGYSIPDDRAFALISSDTSTPELDAAYERALLRGQPAVLGLGIRPEAEAELLRKYGISPDQAFKGYQGIVGELPAAVRFAAIENQINSNASTFPTGNDLFNDTPFATLFRAIQLQDTEAIRTLQGQMSREFSRFQAGGGAAQGQGGTSVGLLSPEERARS